MLSVVRSGSGTGVNVVTKKDGQDLTMQSRLKRRRHSISTTTVLTTTKTNTSMSPMESMTVTMMMIDVPSPSLGRLPLTPSSMPTTTTAPSPCNLTCKLRRNSYLAVASSSNGGCPTSASVLPSPVRVLSSVRSETALHEKPITSPRRSSSSILTRSVYESAPIGQIKELPILRYQYTARNVKVLVGARWRLHRHEVKSIQLCTGAKPVLIVFSDNAMSPDHEFLLPLDTICVRKSDQCSLKLKSRHDGKFRVRIRFTTTADATIWLRVIGETVAHARWIEKRDEVAFLARDRLSKVVLMRHATTNEEHVVKVLRNVRVDDGSCDEVQILRRLYAIAQRSKAFQFVSEYRVVETEREVHVYMPRFPGKTLLHFLSDRPRPQVVSEVEARKVIWRLCESLQALHSHGIVHCDVKLENILLSDVSDVRLIDFGGAYDLTRSAAPSTTSRRRLTMVGTPGYIAPERVLHVDDPPTSAADAFSLGIVLYQLLVGQHPFRSASGRRLTIDDSLSLDWTHMARRLQSRAVSLEAQQLIERLVDSDPTTRISLDQVFQHPWFAVIEQ